MKATIPWLGSALVAVLAASAAAAQCPGGYAIRQAPDACGPGYYAPNEYGMWFGPNYNLYPCCPPFNGMVFGPGGPYGPRAAYPRVPGAPGGPYALNTPGRYGAAGARGVPPGPYAAYGRMVPYPCAPGCEFGQVVPGPVSFPTHPYARSPRDFFMVDVP